MCSYIAIKENKNQVYQIGLTSHMHICCNQNVWTIHREPISYTL